MGMENKVIHILSTGYPQTYPQKGIKMKLELHRPISGVCKSWAIWRRSDKTNSISPLIYFRRPKYVTEQEFEKLMNGLSISLKYHADE
jgi:hypothetical protein